jgi:hypothetical protein
MANRIEAVLMSSWKLPEYDILLLLGKLQGILADELVVPLVDTVDTSKERKVSSSSPKTRARAGQPKPDAAAEISPIRMTSLSHPFANRNRSSNDTFGSASFFFLQRSIEFITLNKLGTHTRTRSIIP